MNPYGHFRGLLRLASALFVAVSVLIIFSAAAHASCTSPANAIEAENCLPGTPQSQWDISGAGDPSIQGFATDISFNVGQTVNFKINTTSTKYHLDIYRMGYYQGDGARLIVGEALSNPVLPSVTLPQTQPACVTDTTTNLVDCGNWAVSASWTIPATATSGIYFAHLVRDDAVGTSHIVFIVRNDASTSAVLFQTADETWQAYNDFGGHSLYGPTGVFNNSQRAYKVSYNRPFHTRSLEPASWVFYAEYPMVRWLEANGYDVTYFTSLDAARTGSLPSDPTTDPNYALLHQNLILKHKLYLSVGHDEYWSGPKRTNIQAARTAGVHLGFFTGNGGFWKTRWENSIDGTSTAYRTLVSYKETLGETKIDPLDPPTWTGTWRDPTFSPPADGGNPENAVTGTLFQVSGCGADNTDLSMQVPAADGQMRFWRGTAIASQTTGQTFTLPAGTLGYEWDVDADNGFRPAGLFPLATATYNLTTDYLIDFGGTYGAGAATHHSTLYRAASKALVFGAGTVQWSWGLDNTHDTYCGSGPYVTDPNMQQATVNLFADMGIQPATLQAGLLAASASSDTTPPVSTITSPASGATLVPGATVTIQGTAADSGGGVVGGVEVSTDGGTTWHPATGRASWSYAWTVSGTGAVTLRSRAVDDSGNLETPGAGVSINIAPPSCPCSIWPSSTTPGTVDSGDANQNELGVKFTADFNGTVTGIRFYKSTANTGTHIGNLWSAAGTLLGTATFTSESASGWQQVSFATPVTVTANTVYVASYSTTVGHYSFDANYFATAGVNNPPLHALENGVSGGNGVFATTPGVFPSTSYNSGNYWVDLVYTPTSTVALVSIAVTPPNPTLQIGNPESFTATGTYSDGSTANITSQVTWSSSNTGIASINSTGMATAVAGGSGNIIATLGTTSGSTTVTVQAALLAITTTTLPNAAADAPYSATLVATGGVQPYTWSLAAGSSLPVGLTLSPAGQITGTPEVAATTTTFTVQVKDSGVQEGLVNPPQTATGTLSLTTGIPFFTIWPSTAAPVTADGGDPSAVELGVRFQADSAGIIAGIRFYKSAANTGTHVGDLWTNTGSLLATATFANETASGWQQVTFPTPVAIAASTPYVASYHTTVGHYSADLNYFATAGVNNPPLQALQNGVSGANGVFTYDTTAGCTPTVQPCFPATSFDSANYWVDVVFENTFGISGTISGAGGNGATVTASLGGITVATTTASAAGAYSLVGLGDGTYTVTPTNAGFTFSPASQSVTVSNGNGTANFSTVFSISGTISGTGGNGATVTLSGAASETVIANASGAYTFTGLASGAYTVTPTQAGFTFTPASQAITINSANATANFASLYSISGTISGTGGSGATVTLTGTLSASATADASGNYSFIGLTNGTYRVTPSNLGFAFTPPSQSVTLASADVSAVNFSSTATYSVAGTISGLGGNGATVNLSGAATATDSSNMVRYSQFDSAALPGSGPWAYFCDHATYTANATALTDPNGGNTALKLVGPASGGSCGTLATGIQQTVSGELASNTYTLSVWARGALGGEQLHLGIQSGNSCPTLQTLTTSWVRYSCSIIATGTPAGYQISFSNQPSVTVYLWGAQLEPRSSVGTYVHTTSAPMTMVTADASGNYSFTGLANGSYTVTPSNTGFTYAPASQPVTVSNANVTALNFSTVYSLSGTISGTGGNGATVNLTGTSTATTTANASGSYTFSGLPNGSYTVTASGTGFAFTPASQPVTVNNANVTGVNFSSTVTYSLSGTISGPAGNGATVTLSGASSATVTANASGAYTFAGLLNGAYTVTPTQAGFTFSPASSAITINNANATANFSTLFSISGTISGTGGGGATVNLTGTLSTNATADASGNYTFTGLAAGPYTVTPSNPGFGFTPNSQSVTVASANVTALNFATTVTYSVAGTISGLGGNGATVSLTGAATATDSSNMVRYSQFDSAALPGSGPWAYFCDYATYTANTTDLTDPNGGNTALKLLGPASGGSCGTLATGIQQTVSGESASNTYTLSVWARGALGGEKLHLGIQSGNSCPTLQTLTTSWVRYSCSIVATGTPAGYQISFSNQPSVTAYLWGAQLEPHPSVGTYVHTTSAQTTMVTADASGNYSFTGLANGSYTVTPSNTGFTYGPASQPATVSNANVTALNFSTVYSLSGTISGPGGSGATVNLTGAGTATVTADASGNYTFTGLANGAYTITPSKTGFTFTPASQPATVANASVTAVNFSTVTYSISGTISGPGGNGATVSLTGAATATATADASGNYTFSGLTNNAYTVTPTKTGDTFTPASQPVTISNASLTGVSFSTVTYSLSGTIGGPGGSGATVNLTGTLSASATADASGNYTVTGLVNGPYAVTPSNPGFAFTPYAQSVTVASANLTGVNFSSTTTYSVSGTISGPGGNGATVNLAGAATVAGSSNMVLYSQFDASSFGNPPGTPNVWNYFCDDATYTANTTDLTDPDGGNTALKLLGPASGGSCGTLATGIQQTVSGESASNTYTLSVWARGALGGEKLHLGIQSGNSCPALQTLTTSWVRYSCSIVATGTPAGYQISFSNQPSVTVYLWGTQLEPHSSVGTYVHTTNAPMTMITADASGNYSFTGLANGGYTVAPTSTGATYTPVSQPATVNNANVTALNFSTVTYSISGTISGTGGNAATVNLTGASAATVTADASGNYTFSGLLNGSYTVTPSQTGYAFTPASQPATVTNANVTALNFSTMTYSLSGAISGAGGNGATVNLTGAATATTTANASGNYTFTGLTNGSYTVTPSNTGFNFTPASQTTTLTTANVTVNFSTTTYSISGTISGQGGNGATVNLTGSATATVTADASGNYTFAGLANGAYTVTPSKTGFTFTPVSQPATVSNANVTALNFTTATYSISGTINGTGGKAATVNLTGTAAATVTADASGNYTFSVVVNGPYTVTPSNAGFAFTPANQAVTVNGASVTAVNFTATAQLAIDQTVSTDRSTSATTIASPTFTTTKANELLLAFISADGPSSGTNTTVSSISGGSLTWVLVERTNTQAGTAEVWRAFAPAVLTNATVTATLSKSEAASITVVTFTGTDTTGTNGSGAIGATGTGNADPGAPTASLTTTRDNSWIIGVGNDWDNATSRTIGANQTLVHQYLATVGDTYWVQRETSTTPVSGTVVTINDTAPTTDRYNLSICEVLPAQ